MVSLNPQSFFCRVYLISLVAQDTAFSAIVTALFLRPIYKVLSEGGDAVHHSAGYKSLLKTKWMTLLGSTLAVVSSKALYINMGMFFILGGDGTPFWINPYLSIFVLGTNLDSVLNDISMLLVCGVLKKFDCEAVAAHFSIAAKHAITPAPEPTGAYAEPSIIFASQGDD
jgi:hypothetical protein